MVDLSVLGPGLQEGDSKWLRWVKTVVYGPQAVDTAVASLAYSKSVEQVSNEMPKCWRAIQSLLSDVTISEQT